jgi:hypothetical protein
MTTFTKLFPSRALCQRAGANHRWLADLAPPLTLPGLVRQHGTRTDYEHVNGRHAEPQDLEMLAAHLGLVHATAYTAELHVARLDQAYVARSGHLIPDFITSRAHVIQARLTAGTVPGPLLGTDTALRLLHEAAGAPAAFYKDTNPRNVLVTPTGLTTVDFDDLTLAPFGYDLAKLIVTLAMTYGPISTQEITRALIAHNVSVTQRSPNLGGVTWGELLAWAELHHILTSQYLGRGGYRYSWHELRPQESLTAEVRSTTDPPERPSGGIESAIGRPGIAEHLEVAGADRETPPTSRPMT